MEQTITDEVEEFLQRHPKSHFLQSAKWASVKIIGSMNLLR